MSGIDPRTAVVASRTDPGRVREHNEDDLGEFADGAGRRLFVVADGMGGHKGGATASHLAVEAIGHAFQRGDGASPDALLREALDAANRQVHDRSLAEAELRGMGTTAVVLLLDREGRGWIAHVGDSRIYRLRGGRIQALTEDHSVVGEMIRQGLLSEAEAAVHPRRNEILRSVGVDPTVEAEIREVDLAPGDVFLLCSDGLSGLVSDDELAERLAGDPPGRAVERLVELANERGGPDNVTVQVVTLPEAGAVDRRVAPDGGGERASSSTTAVAARDAAERPGPKAGRADSAVGLGWIALAVLLGAACTVALAWWQGTGPFAGP